MTTIERSPIGTLLIAATLAVCCLLANVRPASADVPGPISFQGLLLDGSGQPLTDSVDLDFALFGALSGGTALWSESHLGVVVTDGVYSVGLGSTTPIDSAILAAGPVFLEIRVEGETLVPRQQLLAVPYARVAERVQSVGGFSPLFLEQMIAGFDFDGGAPPNTDPAEGTGDTDGDGTPNFLDADNDGDGIGDAAELAIGGDVNRVSPRLTSVTPLALTSYVPGELTIQGTNLGSVQSASFGAGSVVPFDVTPTSFKVTVTPDHLQPTRSVVAVLANGESGQSPPVAIQNVAPTITSVSPSFLAELQATIVTINGTNFVPGTIVVAAGLSLTPSALTPTSLTVTIPPRPAGQMQVRVVHPNQLQASRLVNVFAGSSTVWVFLTQTTFSGNIGGLAAADAVCQAEADAASLPGTYRAWLSDSTTDAASRVPANGPYGTRDGTLVASSFANLTGGFLINQINVLANGTTNPDAGRVWTGTRNDGIRISSLPADHCGNWTQSSGNTGLTGLHYSKNVWSAFEAVSCASTGYRLYCFGN